jgi:FtsH-binding integral membrane protein
MTYSEQTTIFDPTGHPVEKKDNTRITKEVLRYQMVYSLAGLFLGLSCIIGGIILFLHGVTGDVSWTAKFIGAESKVSDAAPGVILFIVGLFVVLVTRFRIKVGH